MDVYILSDPRDGTIRYVGLSKDWKRRVTDHRLACSARRPTPNNGLADWKGELLKHGLSPEGFQIAAGLTLVEAQAMERGYIKTFRESGEPLLNIHDGGAWGNDHVRSVATRVRLGIAHLGKELSPEHRAKIGASGRGKKRSPETCANISASLKGRQGHPASAKQLAALAAGRVVRSAPGYIISPESHAKRVATGRRMVFSFEHRLHISEGGRGRHPTPETRVRLSEAQRLRNQLNPVTAETRAKISEANRGRTRSPEHIAKLRAGHRAYYDAKRRKDIQ